MGDPLLSWLYQPARAHVPRRLYGDDLSFLQARRAGRVRLRLVVHAPSIPGTTGPGDTADKLDAASLARMGEAVLGVMRTLDRVPRGPAEEPHWFAAFGWVLGRSVLVVLGLVSLLPGLRLALRVGGVASGLACCTPRSSAC